MYRFIGSVFAVLTLATCLAAQGQIATVTSEGAFSLRGATVLPDKGVPAWPVMQNDVIIAGDLPTVITFPDGSSVTLEWSAMAQIGMEGQIPVVELQTGAAQYSLKSLTSVKLVGHNHQPITLTRLTGRVVYDNAEAAGRVARTKLHAFLLVPAFGAATGLGYAIYRGISGGASVSPSN